MTAQSHVDSSFDSNGGALQFTTDNVIGMHVVLEAARQHWGAQASDESRYRLINVSTDEVYGKICYRRGLVIFVWHAVNIIHFRSVCDLTYDVVWCVQERPMLTARGRWMRAPL